MALHRCYASLRDWNQSDVGAYTEWEDGLGNYQLMCIDSHKGGDGALTISVISSFHQDVDWQLSIRLMNPSSGFELTLDFKALKLPEPTLFSDKPYYVFKHTDYKVERAYPAFAEVGAKLLRENYGLRSLISENRP